MERNQVWLYLFVIVVAVISLILPILCEAQNPRPLWRGDAYVGGNFDILGPLGGTAEAYSATTTVKAATFVAGASEIEINIPRGGAALDDYGLFYDTTTGDISLRPVPAASVAALDDITNVSSANKVSEDLLQWTGSQWEATRLSSILATLDVISNVTTSTKSDGDVLYWDAANMVWSATPQASGGGGASSLNDLSDVSLTAPSTGEYLQYAGANWINQAFNQVLDDLSDVNASSPTDDYVLTYDSGGGVWQPEAGGSGSGQRTATFLVAPSDARDSSGADYILDGTNDADTFAEMFGLLNAAGGGMIFVLDGIVVADRVISVTYADIAVVGSGPRVTTFQRGYNGAGVDDAVISLEPGGDRARLMGFGIDGEKATYATATNTGLKVDRVFNCRFEALFVTDNAGDGLYVDGAGGAQNFENEFNGILTTANTGDGMQVQAVNECSFVNSRAFDNSARGFNFSSSNDRLVIRGLIAGNNTTDGIFYAGTNGIVASCVVYSNGDNGIETSNAVGFSITGCNVSNNTGNGIYLDDDSVLSNSTIKSNGAHGVVIVGNGNAINGNLIFDNTNDGITTSGVAKNENSITGNNIQDNGSEGIRLFGGVRNFISGNRIYSNDSYGIYTDDQIDTIIASNHIQDNGGATTSSQMFLEDDNSNCYQIYNTIVGNNAALSLIHYDDAFATNTSVFAFNVVDGEYSTVYTEDSVPPHEWATISDYSGRGESMIFASDVDTRIGIATSDITEVSTVLYVAAAANTNPIATSWDQFSDPNMKTNVEVVDATDEQEIDSEIEALNFIRFDWKFTIPEPVRADFDSDEEFDVAYQTWLSRKTDFENNQVKKNQISLDITDPDFPPELGTYTKDGKRIGINTSQVVNRAALMLQKARRVIKNQQDRINTLETAGQNLAQRIRTLEDAVFGP